MHAAATRLALVAILAVVAVFGVPAPSAQALSLLDLLYGPPKPVQTVPPVAAPISADPPDGAARGTMLLVHAGGWAGHDGYAQDLLRQTPGEMLRARGWRVVSIDYEEGTAGLQDVLNAAGAELARGTGDGPLCIYGESAGAQLALVAAARLRAIDCVIGLGTPTDLARYATDAKASANPQVQLVGDRITRFFGDTPDELAPWSPLALAGSIRADVLLLHESDDVMVPTDHTTLFQAARPTTQAVVLPAGDPADPSTEFVHGTISAEGRAQYAAAIGALAGRAVAARDAAREATRLGCTRVSRTVAEAGLPALQAALRCLGRVDPLTRGAAVRSWRKTSIRLRGEITAAGVWAALRASSAGRHALAAAARGRVEVKLRLADRSRVILRAAAAGG